MEAPLLARGRRQSVTSLFDCRFWSFWSLPLQFKNISFSACLMYLENTVNMPDIVMPDPEELGGNVTKPFKFVTGINVPPFSRVNRSSLNIG